MSSSSTPTARPTVPDPAPPSDSGSPLRGRVGNARLGAALSIAGIAWATPFLASIIVLVPAKLQQIDSANKIGDFALVTVVGSIVALLANIVFGAFSDRTRSRFGGRNPWILVGGIGLGLSVAALGFASTFASLLVLWCVLQLFQNMYLAPVTAIIADRIAPRRRGLMSGLLGTSNTVGQAVGAIVGSQFILHIDSGFFVLAFFPVVGAIALVILAPDTSNATDPRSPLTARVFLESFSFPRRARDFYWALFGRLLLVLAFFLITNYQLYILTDYIKLSDAGAAAVVSLAGTVSLVTGVVAGLLTGPISDRWGRRKPPVIIATALIGIGALVPLLFPAGWSMVAFSGIAGFGLGMYWAVDVALVVQVLPNKNTQAKDLGILNMANTGGQILAPVVAAGAIAATGGYQPLFIISVVCAALAAACIIPIRSAR